MPPCPQAMRRPICVHVLVIGLTATAILAASCRSRTTAPPVVVLRTNIGHPVLDERTQPDPAGELKRRIQEYSRLLLRPPDERVVASMPSMRLDPDIDYKIVMVPAPPEIDPGIFPRGQWAPPRDWVVTIAPPLTFEVPFDTPTTRPALKDGRAGE